MPPAAVAFRPPAASSQLKAASAPQNPNPESPFSSQSPGTFSAFSAGGDAEAAEPFGFPANANACGVVHGFGSLKGPKGRSAASRRSKPRLVKVRRHSDARSTVESSDEVGSARYQFAPECDVNNRVKRSSISNQCLPNTSFGSGNHAQEVNCSFENVGFVFGAAGGVSLANNNLEFFKRESSVSDGKLSKNDYDKNSGKFESVRFVFGSNQRDLGFDSGSESRNSFDSTEKPVPGSEVKVEADSPLPSGNPCATSATASGPNLGLQRDELIGGIGNSCFDGSNKVKMATEVQVRREDFHSAENEIVLESVSDMEKGQFSDNAKATDCQVDQASGNHSKESFTFGTVAGKLTPGVSLDKDFNNKGTCKLNLDEDGNWRVGKGPEFKENVDPGLVFGSSWFSFASNLNAKDKESCEHLEKLPCGEDKLAKQSTGTEFQRMKNKDALSGTCPSGSLNSDKGHGIFIFEFKGNDENSSICTKSREMSRSEEMTLNADNFVNISANPNDQTVNSSSDFMGYNTFGSCNNASKAGGRNEFNLPESMKNLNIGDRGDLSGANKPNASHVHSSTYVETASTINTSPCVSSPLHDSSASPMPHENKNPTLSGLFDPVDNGINFKKFDKDQSVESIENSSHKPFIFHAGASETCDTAQHSCNAMNDSKLADDKEMKEEFGFVNAPDSSVEATGDFRIPQWDPLSFKANLTKDLKFELNEKSRLTKHKKFKKNMKSRQPSTGKHHGSDGSCYQEKADSSNCYSPMDFSPYQETLADDQYHKSSSGTLDESVNENSTANLNSTILANNGCIDENTSVERLDCSLGNSKYDKSVSGAEAAYCKSNVEHVSGTFGAAEALAEDEIAYPNTASQASDCSKQFVFASDLSKIDQTTFSFSASSSTEVGSLTRKQLNKKKHRAKSGYHPFVISPHPVAGDFSVQFSNFSGASFPFDTKQGLEGHLPFPHKDQSILHSESNTTRVAGDASFSVQFSNSASFPSDTQQGQEGHRLFPDQSILNSESSTTHVETKASVSAAIQEACEKWRLRGNQAYRNGRFSRAEEYYTKGVNSVPPSETSGHCLKPLLLCHSNRAASRMSLGNLRAAIEDCIKASEIDPNFLKVQIRAANCHLILGEVEKALDYFNKCLESGTSVCLDRRLMIEAADGLQKTQKVANYMNLSIGLLEEKTSDAATRALEMISESMTISKFSEKLLEMKAEALYKLRKYEEVIHLCEQSLVVAEKNFGVVVRLWRLDFMAKSFFCLGKLEEALDLTEKIDINEHSGDRNHFDILKSLESLSATIHKLLHSKNVGNEAFRSGKYLEAVEHYTSALSSSVESRPFAAICFCNRAAAHQALGQIADAIADCSLAIALDGYYSKAISRRATLHELIRDYGQAASDIQRLIGILKNQSNPKSKASGSLGGTDNKNGEMWKAKKRGSLMEEEAKKGTPLDFYLILGVKHSDAAADIKKAYHKAALRHHPDKAGQIFARSESGNEGQLWKEIATEVHESADRLFKIIGEAYAVLSDPSKRANYDLEEEIRRAPKESSCYSTYRSPSHFSSSPFERGASRQHRQEHWRTYGCSQSRW